MSYNNFSNIGARDMELALYENDFNGDHTDNWFCGDIL